MNEQKFWMVWKEGGGNCTSKHTSYISAKTEAERLAAKHPDKVFYVLVADTWVKSVPVPVTIFSGDMAC